MRAVAWASMLWGCAAEEPGPEEALVGTWAREGAYLTEVVDRYLGLVDQGWCGEVSQRLRLDDTGSYEDVQDIVPVEEADCDPELVPEPRTVTSRGTWQIVVLDEDGDAGLLFVREIEIVDREKERDDTESDVRFESFHQFGLPTEGEERWLYVGGMGLFHAEGE